MGPALPVVVTLVDLVCWGVPFFAQVPLVGHVQLVLEIVTVLGVQNGARHLHLVGFGGVVFGVTVLGVHVVDRTLELFLVDLLAVVCGVAGPVTNAIIFCRLLKNKGSVKTSAFSTNAQSRFGSVVLDGVLGEPRLARHP